MKKITADAAKPVRKRGARLTKKGKAPADRPMRPEYRLDYGAAKPNRFSQRMAADAVAVVLDPDVAAAFPSSKRVNALLRSMIPVLPAESKRRLG